MINPTHENLVDVLHGVNEEYRSSGNAAWHMRDSTAGVVARSVTAPRHNRRGDVAAVGDARIRRRTTSSEVVV